MYGGGSPAPLTTGSASSVTCNRCGTGVDGIAYRTACFHLLCPSCAKEAFQHGVTCSVCNSVLSKGDVKEITVGVPAQYGAADALFQLVYGEGTTTDAVIRGLSNVRLAAANVEQFVCTQLLHDAAVQLEARRATTRDKAALENQLVRAVFHFCFFTLIQFHAQI
jgi:hypothetical protein